MAARKFLEAWANLDVSRRMWKGIALAEGALVLLLALALLKKVAQPPVVIAVPGLEQRIVYRSGEVPEALIRDVSLAVALDYMTFSPADVEKKIAQVLRFVDAGSYGTIKSELLATAQNIRQTGYAQMFSPTDVVLQGDTAVVRGVLTIKVGAQTIKEETGDVVVVFKTGAANERNPYGLYVRTLAYRSHGPVATRR